MAGNNPTSGGEPFRIPDATVDTLVKAKKGKLQNIFIPAGVVQVSLFDQASLPVATPAVYVLTVDAFGIPPSVDDLNISFKRGIIVRGAVAGIVSGTFF